MGLLFDQDTNPVATKCLFRAPRPASWSLSSSANTPQVHSSPAAWNPEGRPGAAANTCGMKLFRRLNLSWLIKPVLLAACGGESQVPRPAPRVSCLPIAVVVALTALVPTDAGATPGAYALPSQWAHAEWLVRERGRPILYFADAIRFAHPVVGVKTLAYVGKARCRPARQDPELLNCGAYVPGIEIPPHQFVIDPSLSAAQLTLEVGQDDAQITWTGQGSAPSPEFSYEGTPGEELDVEAGVRRQAGAEASLFGSSFGEDSLFQAVLASGVAAGLHLDERRFEVDRDGRLLFRATVPRSTAGTIPQ